MPLWIILAAPVVFATMVTMAACIIAGRSERFLEDPAPDEADYIQDLRPVRPSTDPALIPVRLAGHSDRIEF